MVKVTLPLVVVAPKLEELTLVAFELLQVSVADPLLAIDDGDTDKFTVGAGGAATLTVADLVVDPPGPLAVIEYV